MSDHLLQPIMLDVVKGSRYTLPIISTYPRGLLLSALGIRLKVSRSTLFDRHNEMAD